MKFKRGNHIRFETSGLVPKGWALVTDVSARGDVTLVVDGNEWVFDGSDPKDFTVTAVAECTCDGFIGEADPGCLAAEDECLFRKVPAPVAKVGDRVKINGNSEDWYEVKYEAWDRPHEVYVAGPRLWAWWPTSKITDVYTADEFARNSALVQIHERTEWPDEAPGTGMDDDLGWKQGFNFLTSKATAALGTFTPVPDRPIKAGDCVRSGGYVFLAEQQPSKPSGTPYEYKDPTAHVAPEDPAYIEPEPKPMPCEGTVCNCHEIDLDGNREPTPQPRPWTEWELITAGDGRHFEREGDLWHELNAETRWHTTDEIAERGPVRRAEVITLPDHGAPVMYATLYPWDRRKVAVPNRPGGEQIWPEDARRFAAELLAAALQAEQAGGRE